MNNEAIVILKQIEKYEDEVDFTYKDALEAIQVAIKALEELQMYKQGGLCLIPSDVYRKQCEELDRLKEIGTVEEFKALKEKSIPKQRKITCIKDFNCLVCPSCRNNAMHTKKYCIKCGQRLVYKYKGDNINGDD